MIQYYQDVYPEGSVQTVKFESGGYLYPVDISCRDGRLWFKFRFNRPLMDQIKLMEGTRWHGFEDEPIKQWSVPNTPRNRFQIAFLRGQNPYAHYDRPLVGGVSDIESDRVFSPRRDCLRAHQIELTQHVITYLYCILAAEMGTGKTLSVIEAMEYLYRMNSIRSWFYIAPKSALAAVQLEFEKWHSLVQPQFHTYDGLKSLMENWPKNSPPPQGVIFDESSRVKTPTAQRSQAAQHLADAIRREHALNGCVVLMSGSPAPKSPLDWWQQCEIACPGFIKEGTYEKFRRNLAIMAEGQNEIGQTYSKLVTWKDDEKKCAICGLPEKDPEHDPVLTTNIDELHAYTPSRNEVARLYKRLKGLVIVKFKKDALDLPEKQYVVETCTPSQSIINAAKLITSRSESAIKTLTLLRELSDGFQYSVEDVGVEQCPLCNGTKSCQDWMYSGPDELYEEIQEKQLNGQSIPSDYFKQVERTCTYCNGTGEATRYSRETVQIPCPKEDKLLEIIDRHDDVGRLVCYAGFTGSVERVTQIFIKAQWDVIRVDGRGWWSNLPGDAKELLRKFQYEREQHPRLAFIGQPGAAGMGLTLTASPTIVYYSNDFNGESRTQSEDRIHRMGMDKNRGATIIDLIHLPTDLVVLESLKKKRKLEQMSMGEFKAALEGVS